MRKPMNNRRKDKAVFTSSAISTHKKNLQSYHTMRGGINLW